MKPWAAVTRGLALASVLLAATAGPALAMDEAEMQAAKADIYRVAATPEDGLDQIKSTAEIRQRLDRLMASPAWPELSLRTRQQALVYFGSDSERLSFDKPSDVLAKMQTWFPAELEQAGQTRSSEPLPLPIGPAANWETQPAAFVALWNCMPAAVWWAPQQMPFVESVRTVVDASPVAARVMGPESLKFSECLARLESRYSSATTRSRFTPAVRERVVEHLAGKFARTLDTHDCAGRGPDDCVLLLSLWADVLPADPALFATLNRLDADLRKLAPSLRAAVASRAQIASLQQQPQWRVKGPDARSDCAGASRKRCGLAGVGSPAGAFRTS